MSESEQVDESTGIDPHLKEQNGGIFNAFALQNHRVLTTPEIVDHVDLGERQTRRRLNDLEDEGVVGSRKPGGTKLWWLETEVEEPVSAKYPILRLLQQKISLQLVVLGLLSGVVAVILVSAATVTMANSISPPFISQDLIIRGGLLMSLVAAGFLLAAGIVASADWLFSHLGIEIRHNPN